MNAETQSRDSPLSLEAARIVDRICDAFEACWGSGSRPALADHLSETEYDLQPALLRELIAVELFYRHRLGEHLQPGEYLTQFPRLDAAWLADAIHRQVAAGAAPPLATGQTAGLAGTFGDYELLEEIAHGGMGVVYKARQVTLNRTVAIKMILAGPRASPAEVDRFHAEAQAAAGLDHPGIVPIFEVGEIQGQHFFSMGYIEGQSLADRLAKGPLPSRSAAQLVREICDAAQYAHERQVIHRDLKPANILLDGEGRPRITDFGLAKCLSDDAGRTLTGQMMGTPSFIPPEQAAGKLDLIGPAADVYALGAVLYALLTGRPPFQAASSIDTLRQVIDDDPLPPRELSPGIPRDLETIALKCLQKPINQRYASARAMGEDLQRFLDGAPILARPVSRWEHFGRWCKRKPLLAALSAAVVVLLVAIAAVSTTAAVGYHWQLARLELAKQAENRAKQEALAKLWDSYLATAGAGTMSRRAGQRFDSLRAIQRAMALATPKDRSTDELRTVAIAALALPDFEEFKQLPSYSRGLLPATVDPKFERYARGDAAGAVSVRQVADDAEICRIPGIGTLSDYEGLVYGPDGRFLMQWSPTAEWPVRRIWNVQGPPAQVLSCGEAFDFAPDGRRAAVIEKDFSIQLYDLTTSDKKTGAGAKKLGHYKLAGFSPDWLVWNPRRPILFARAVDHLSYRLLDLETGRFGPLISAPYGIIWVRWHPEGGLLAIVDHSSPHPRIQIVRAESGAPELPPLEGHRVGGVMIRFNHYGDRLLSTDWTGLWRLWDARTGQPLLTMPAWGPELRFSDDDRLAGLDGSPEGLRLFRFESGREIYKIVHRRNSVATIYSDPDGGNCQLDAEGRLLAFSVPEGIAVVDVVRGEDVALLRMANVWPVRADNSGALITHGSAGLLRWPMTLDAATGRRTYGPPQNLARAQGRVLAGGASDKGCRVFAVGNFGDGALELVVAEGRQILLSNQDDVRHCDVSSDGSWIATGSHGTLKGAAAQIWDARTGHHVRDLPVDAFCRVKFSPDGNWLMTTGGSARLWHVDDWKEGPNLKTSAQFGAFSATGDLLALQDVPGVVRLVVTATGKEVARLTAPEPIRLAPLNFTRDGSRLICWSDEEESLFVFNLGLIRSNLAAMGLDWESPPCPANDGPLPAPVSVQFIVGK